MKWFWSKGQQPTRVLSIAQYPIKKPSHGGQVRLRGIVDALSSIGSDVSHMGIYPDFNFDADLRGPVDTIISDEEFNQAYFAEPLFGDLTITSFVLSRPALCNQIMDRIVSFSPEVVWLEHPFLYPLLAEVRAQRSVDFRLIYSSANDETKLKRILIDSPSTPGTRDIELVKTVQALEEDAIRNADLVVCINDEEAAGLRAKGYTAAYLPATTTLNFDLSVRRPPRGAEPYVAYAASSYWLNVDGFAETFSDGLGFLPFGQRLAIAGSCCDAILNDKRYKRHESLNSTRAEFKGFLSPGDLLEFYLNAKAVINPVTSGAGSNLKTADALASGRPVISTSKGLEGFRSLVGDAVGAGVYEARTPMEFRQLVRSAMAGELRPPPRSLSAKFRATALRDNLEPIFDGWRQGLAQTEETVIDGGAAPHPAS